MTANAVNENITKDGPPSSASGPTPPCGSDGEVFAVLEIARTYRAPAGRGGAARARDASGSWPTAPGHDLDVGRRRAVHLLQPGLARLHRAAVQSEVGDGWTEDVHRDDLQGCLDTYLRAFEARRRFTMEYRLRRYDGEYRWVLDTGVARFERDGRFAGYIGTCIDISERKRAEEALRTSQRSLDGAGGTILAGRLLQAQEVERQPVARELHDDLTQRLAALAIEVGSLEQRVDRSAPLRPR